MHFATSQQDGRRVCWRTSDDAAAQLARPRTGNPSRRRSHGGRRTPDPAPPPRQARKPGRCQNNLMCTSEYLSDAGMGRTCYYENSERACAADGPCYVNVTSIHCETAQLLGSRVACWMIPGMTMSNSILQPDTLDRYMTSKAKQQQQQQLAKGHVTRGRSTRFNHIRETVRTTHAPLSVSRH